MSEKHIVTLNGDELASIESLLRKGKVAARRLRPANILRFADEGYSDQEIHDLTTASIASIERVRAKFVRGGLEWASRKSRALVRHPNWMANKKRFLSRWHARLRRKDTRVGRCNSWRIVCCSCK